MKPGNSVEEKTLMIRKGETKAGESTAHQGQSQAWLSGERHRDRGSRERKVAVMARRSRYRTVWEGPEIKMG